MTTWVDFVVYAALAVALWECIPAWGRFTIPVIADRNPDWLLGHPQVARQLAGSRWFSRSCRAWSVFTVAVLFAVQAGAWPPSGGAPGPNWETLKDLNSGLVIAGLFYVFCCLFLFERWLRTTVPLAERRQATLVPRSIDDHVPRPVRLAVYGLVALHLAAWLIAGVTGRYATTAFWGTLAFQYAVSALLLFLVVIAVRRKPSAIDGILGPGYRRTEVRVAFASQLLPIANGAARLYEHTGGASAESLDRLSHLVLVAYVGALAIAATMWSRRPSGGLA